MEHTSKLEQTAHAPVSERFVGRTSGTRRIVRFAADSSVSEAVALRPAVPEPRQRWLVRALDAGWRLDTRRRGRWLWSSGAIAATSGAALPLLTACDAPLPALHAASWLSLAALSLAGFLWAARYRPKRGPWALASAREQVAGSLHSLLGDLTALAHAPKNLRLSLLSRLARVAGFAGLALSSVLACLELSLGRAAPTLSAACLWSASCLFGSQLLSWALRLQTQPPLLEAAELALAVREFPPVVELSSPLELESVFLDPTPLHQLMAGLSSWAEGARGNTAQGCAAALQRHLGSSCLPRARIELGRWLGASGADGKADLVVEDSVLVDFQIGLERDQVQQVVERLQSYQPAWGDRPIVVVVVGLPGAGRGALQPDAIAALRDSGDAPRWIVALAR